MLLLHRYRKCVRMALDAVRNYGQVRFWDFGLRTLARAPAHPGYELSRFLTLFEWLAGILTDGFP